MTIIIISILICLSIITLIYCLASLKNNKVEYNNNYSKKTTSKSNIQKSKTISNKSSSKSNNTYRIEKGFYKDFTSKGHPSYQVLVNSDKKTWVRYKLTHEKSHKNRQLFSNPDPSDKKSASFIDNSPTESKIFTRGKEYKNWKLDPRDKAIIRNRTIKFLDEKMK